MKEAQGGKVPTWAVELRVHVPTVWRYFYNPNKFAATLWWRGLVIRRAVFSTVYVVVTVIRPEGRVPTESDLWQERREHTEPSLGFTRGSQGGSQLCRRDITWGWADCLPTSQLCTTNDFPATQETTTRRRRRPYTRPVTPSAHPGCLFPHRRFGGLASTLVASHTSLFSYKFELSNLLIKTIYVSMCVCTCVC